MMVPVEGSVIGGDSTLVTPPSTSDVPALRPAAAPVTRSLEPLTVVPSCRVTPPLLVPAGLPRAHWPVVAVSVPDGFVVQPRLVSKLSKNTVPDGGGGGGGGAPLSTKSRRLGEPVPGLPTTPAVASATSSLRTCDGVQDGFTEAISAAAPAACGVAIEVPLIVLVAVSEVFHAEVIEEPGANRSRHVPKLENDDRASLLVVEPSVIALGTRAGEKLQALALELPAAIA